jgi:4-amino-4-deoxy-L-arabinose transferase-like glycosyltransferase
MLLILRKFQVLCWRGSFLLAALFWGLLLTVITEFLSLLKWLDFWHLVGAWGIVLLLLWLILAFGNWNFLEVRQDLHGLSISRFELSLLVGVFLMVVIIGVIAWVAPPNTWDSMTYHMSRVIHWMQNKSVVFYPTAILRQLHSNPWSEFAILHFQILSGGDRFANLIQWFSMLGSLVGVSLLAKELGATSRGQIFAPVVCATIPMGILQGSSTQTDYVVSFWLVCFVYFALLLRKRANFHSAFGTGAALGLAILTKATAYIFTFPFLAWLGLSSIRHFNVKRILFIALALVIAFSVNFGHYARNFDLYGSPLGPGKEGPNYVYTNDIFSFAAVTSNLIRNIGLHLCSPHSRVNAALDNTISVLHKFIGISSNDERTTWNTEKFCVPKISYHEDNAGNPIHLLIIAMSLIFYMCQRHSEHDLGQYIYPLLLACLLFCVYLKWQPWHSRLHLPIFVLFAPFTGLMISRIRGSLVVTLIMALLLGTSLQCIFYNTTRPILGRDNIFTKSRMKQYFTSRPSLFEPYKEAVQIISELHGSDIGLIIGGNDWEYPLWVLLREKTNKIIRLEHVNVTNISQKYDKNHIDTLSQCAIFAINVDPLRQVSIGDVNYLRKWSYDSVSVYTPSPSAWFSRAAQHSSQRAGIPLRTLR